MRARRLLIALCLVTACGPADARSPKVEDDSGTYDWPLVGVIDGDSVKVVATPRPKEKSVEAVRLRGVDTPEKGKKAKCDRERELSARATAFTREFLARGTPQFSNIGREKYGRLLADITVNGQSLADALVSAGLAKRYSGGVKPIWCEEAVDQGNR